MPQPLPVDQAWCFVTMLCMQEGVTVSAARWIVFKGAERSMATTAALEMLRWAEALVKTPLAGSAMPTRGEGYSTSGNQLSARRRKSALPPQTGVGSSEARGCAFGQLGANLEFSQQVSVPRGAENKVDLVERDSLQHCRVNLCGRHAYQVVLAAPAQHWGVA